MEGLTDRLLNNLDNFADLGRQRAFELGNSYYFRVSGDNEFWRKELPDGTLFSVKFEVEYDEKGHPIEIKDMV